MQDGVGRPTPVTDIGAIGDGMLAGIEGGPSAVQALTQKAQTHPA